MLTQTTRVATGAEADGASVIRPRTSQVSTSHGRWLVRLISALSHRRAVWVVTFCALVLTSSALTMGLTGDDHLHALMLRPNPGIEGLTPRSLDLFAFATKDPRDTHGLMQEGVFPWWTTPSVRIAFFRPLSAATHWLDHQLWPDSPLLMHLHSMVWLGLMLLAVARVYKRLVTPAWVAMLAFMLYALDDARAAPVGWIANRNAMIAVIPPMFALLAHDRARTTGDRRSRLLAPLCLAVGLFCGEAAVQMFGYLIAYALCLDTAPRRQRLLSLLPYFAVLVVWRISYVLAGYGVHGSGLYLDPAGHPLSFLGGLVTRLPVLLLSEFALPWSEFWDLAPVFAPVLQPVMLVLAALVIAGMVWLLLPLWRRDAQVRFWAVGTLLATIPACAAVPNDRLLTATGIGGAALLGRLAGSIAEGTYPRTVGLPLKLAGAGLLFVHLVFSPLVLPFRTKAVDGMEVLMAHADQSVPSDPGVTSREVVVLNPPVDPLAIYFPAYREAHGIPRPHYFRWLATGASDLTVERRDAHTLRLHPQAGYLANSSQWMLRDPSRRSWVGERIVMDDVTIEVTQVTSDGRPDVVDAHFREPLDSSQLTWMQWGVHEYVPFKLPAQGQRVLIPAVDMKKALMEMPSSDS